MGDNADGAESPRPSLMVLTGPIRCPTGCVVYDLPQRGRRHGRTLIGRDATGEDSTVASQLVGAHRTVAGCRDHVWVLRHPHADGGRPVGLLVWCYSHGTVAGCEAGPAHDVMTEQERGWGWQGQTPVG